MAESYTYTLFEYVFEFEETDDGYVVEFNDDYEPGEEVELPEQDNEPNEPKAPDEMSEEEYWNQFWNDEDEETEEDEE